MRQGLQILWIGWALSNLYCALKQAHLSCLFVYTKTGFGYMDTLSASRFGITNSQVDTLTQFVVGLFINDDGPVPRLLGSGVILSRHNQTFLCTATHVLTDARGFELVTPCSIGSDGKVDWAVINGHGLCSERDECDVAILSVSNQLFELSGKRSLPIEFSHPNQKNRNSWNYVVVGYPETKTKFIKNQWYRTPPYATLCKSHPETFYETREIDPSGFIALQYGKTIQQGNSVGQTPQPYGMSGGAVWSVDEIGGEINLRRSRLVGILTDYKQELRLIKATDISTALFLIDKLVR